MELAKQVDPSPNPHLSRALPNGHHLGGDILGGAAQREGDAVVDLVEVRGRVRAKVRVKVRAKVRVKVRVKVKVRVCSEGAPVVDLLSKAEVDKADVALAVE